jgi:organic hydroperoxide reductase OsmC/OhrA
MLRASAALSNSWHTLPKEEALALVEETHEKVCPYTHATRGNIDFSLDVEGAEESQ